MNARNESEKKESHNAKITYECFRTLYENYSVIPLRLIFEIYKKREVFELVQCVNASKYDDHYCTL
jgi:hypothetical protein